jgi:serine/threonine-protein phosphatase 2B catalytic subunit
VSFTVYHAIPDSQAFRRKSDIENERLPPDLVDPEEARAILSNPVTPIDETSSPGLEAIDENSVSPGSSGAPGSPALPSPSSPTMSGAFRRGHGRQQSLGTTSTSPSTRRRSIENTASLIREAMDEKGPEGHSELEALADSLSSPGGMNRRRSDSSSGGLPNQAVAAEEKN